MVWQMILASFLPIRPHIALLHHSHCYNFSSSSFVAKVIIYQTHRARMTCYTRLMEHTKLHRDPICWMTTPSGRVGVWTLPWTTQLASTAKTFMRISPIGVPWYTLPIHHLSSLTTWQISREAARYFESTICTRCIMELDT